MMAQATKRRISNSNFCTFRVECKSTISDPIIPLEYFTNGKTYQILGIVNGDHIVVYNNYGTPHAIENRTSEFFKHNFKLVDLPKKK